MGIIVGGITDNIYLAVYVFFSFFGFVFINLNLVLLAMPSAS